MFFLSGVTGARPDLTVAADPEAQIRDAFAFLKEHLAAADLTFDDAVEMTTYHVDLREHLSVFMKVKDEYVTAPYPAWTAIGVSQLITEGTIVEIRLIARRAPTKRRRALTRRSRGSRARLPARDPAP